MRLRVKGWHVPGVRNFADLSCEMRAVTRPVVLLNCLDTLYGHPLLKLLNAQYHLDRRADFDLAVMLPSPLAWVVPDAVAQVWSVGPPLRRGTEWNDWLAREIRRRGVEAFGEVSLGHALSHPRPDEYEAAGRVWCERYGASHVVVVHGWNMLLPSAHAGGVVELIGPERRGNFMQHILFREAGDCREMLFRYRFVDGLTPRD